MFTGIVTSMGRVAAVGGGANARRLSIETGGLSTAGWQVGDSVAVSGVCLTLVGVAPGRFDAELSGETLARTTLGRLAAGSVVNLEPAVAAGSALGGPPRHRPRGRRRDRAQLRRGSGFAARRGRGAGGTCALHRREGLGDARRREPDRRARRGRRLRDRRHTAYPKGHDARRASRRATRSISRWTCWRAISTGCSRRGGSDEYDRGDPRRARRRAHGRRDGRRGARERGRSPDGRVLRAGRRHQLHGPARPRAHLPDAHGGALPQAAPAAHGARVRRSPRHELHGEHRGGARASRPASRRRIARTRCRPRSRPARGRRTCASPATCSR